MQFYLAVVRGFLISFRNSSISAQLASVIGYGICSSAQGAPVNGICTVRLVCVVGVVGATGVDPAMVGVTVICSSPSGCGLSSSSLAHKPPLEGSRFDRRTTRLAFAGEMELPMMIAALAVGSDVAATLATEASGDLADLIAQRALYRCETHEKSIR